MQMVKGIGRSVKRKLRQSRTRILRSLGMLKADWVSGLPTEASFWEKALKDPARCWTLNEYHERTDPDFELQSELKTLIGVPQGVVRILDVGAGPLTRVGKKWTGQTVEITAIDPLADVYQELLRRVGIRPPVETKYGHGEKLLEQFHENQFDLAYASNALDHSYDPLLAINQMFAVIKPAHFVYLWHFANEGLISSYSGLHQWNFDVQGNDFVISDGRKQLSLATEFRNRGKLESQQTHAFGTKVVIAKLRKLSQAGS